MKAKKLLALLLAIVFVVTQFAMLSTVSAATALTGRDEFLKGINIHPSLGYHAPYTSTYKIVMDAKALGANIIRTNFNQQSSHLYDLGFAELANEKGMQVWMTTGFIFYDKEKDAPIPADEINIAGITQEYTNAATILKGKVAYYQLGNEMNIEMHKGSKNGLEAKDYKDCSGIAAAIYAANNAIKAVDPSAKTVVNFSWQNMGLLEAIKSVKLDAETGLPATSSTTNVVYADWDIIGLNWYSDGANEDFKENGWFGKTIDYPYIISQLESKYPDKKVVVSETGLYPIENADGSIGYKGDAQWLEDFLTYCYDNPYVLGFMPYELYDQPHRSYDTEDGSYEYDKEAHFGLMEQDGTKKDVYNTICSLYGGTGEVDRTIPAAPAMNNKGELNAVFSAEGGTGKFSTVFNGQDWLTVEADAFDFTGGEMVEFDFYVEDAKALKSAMNRIGLNLMVRVYDTDGGMRDCRYVTKEYIVNDGWNHISIPKSAFFDYDIDWAKINKIAVQFYGGINDVENYSEISGMNVAIANICSTNIVAPENVVDDTKIVIDESGYEVPANRQVNWFGARNGKILATAANVKSCDRIEFDLYVDNLELFNDITAKNEFCLDILGDSDGTYGKVYYLSQYVTKQGWNHIVIKITDADESAAYWYNKIARYRLRFLGEGTDPIVHPALHIEFKNFNALYADWNNVPAINQSEGMLVINESVKDSGTYGSAKGTWEPNIDFKANKDLSGYDYFEFDYYVENLNNLKQLASKLYLEFVNDGGTSYNAIQFLDLLTKDGWNHIKLSKSASNNSSVLSRTRYIRFGIDKNSDVTVGANDHFCTANLVATVDAINRVPAIVENQITIHEGKKFSNKYGTPTATGINKYPTAGDQNITVSSDKKDFTVGDYVEFDYFVDDVVALKEKLTGVHINIIASSNQNGSWVNFIDQITKNGWNHIKIEMNDLKYYSNGAGHLTMSNVQYVRFRVAFAESALNVEFADRYAIANVCVTADAVNIVPSIVESEGMLVIKEGVKDSGTYGSAKGTWEPNIDFKENKDLSGYDYFEFDYYVENLNNLKQLASKLYLQFVNNGGTSYNEIYFHDLLTKDGWNHVKLSKTDSSRISVLSKTRYIRFGITKNSDVTVGAEDTYKTANLIATIRNGSEPVEFNQSVTVGKDQTEIIVTWLDTVDREGKVVLTKDGTETEFVAVKRFAEAKGLYSYSATITGLTANTSYSYRIKADDLTSEEYAYKTKDFDDTFSFVHISDVQYNGSAGLLENWKNTLSAINTNFPETSFIVNSGDVSDLSGNNDLYQAVKSPKLLKQYAMGVVPGNHDDSSAEGGGGYYTLNFATPDTYEVYEGRALNGYDYWYGYNNVLFISLNSLISNVEYHKNFVTKVINEQGDKFDWIIVNCHYSLFSASYHSTESATINHRNGLAPLFTKLGVDLVLSGHDHVYDRSYLMDGSKPKADANNFATSADGVLYISATTASGMKYNTAVDSCKSYSAKIVEEEYGFINYEVSEDEITLTFYNAEDMSVLDKFTIYNDNGDHTVEADSDLLKDKNLENVKLDSNGNYTASFDSADITDACTIELDFGLANGNTLNTISVSLVDANGNSAKKNFSNLQSGWNHLVANTSDFSGVDLTKITAVKLTGAAGVELDIANLYVGHIYTDKNDTTCNGCDNEREKLDNLDPSVIPPMVQSDGMLIMHEGLTRSGTYANFDSSNPLGGNYTNNSVIDFSKYSYIEFDFYADNANDLKALLSEFTFNFWQSDSRQLGLDFLDQITQDGWNHVKLAISKNSGVALNNIKYYRFRPDIIDGASVDTSSRYNIANICATLDAIDLVPGIVANQITIHEGKKFSNKYGTPTKTGVNKYPTAGDQNITVSSDKKDFTVGDYVEFDYFVDDVVTLKEKLTGIHINVIASSNNNGSWVNFIDQITKNGWNHIKIEMDDLKYYGNGGYLNMSNVQYVRFQVAFAESALNVEFADRYAIANVCVTVDAANIVPAIVESDGMLKIHEGVKDSGTYGTARGTWEPNIDFGANKDLSGYDYFEFDYYVENLENLKQLASKHYLEFVNDGGTAYNEISFLNLLTKDGWNHVKLSKSASNNISVLSRTRYIRFRIDKNSGVTVGSEDSYKTANLIATVDPINLVPEIVANQITIHEGKKFANKYGTPTATGINKYPTAGDQNISVSSDKKDFTVGDYVEFDYFVDDVVALKEKLTGIHINLIASNNNGGSWVNFIDQITANGWNHIKIEMDDLKYYGNGGYLNMTNVQYVRFRVAFAESALNVEFADRYAIANVCVTKDIVIPTDVMKEKVDFIGAEFKEIVFGAYGYSEDITADITNTRMIELDVYVEDDSNSTIGIEIGDAEGVFAYYEFENLTNGWNHLAVRIDDMDGADELDKANITNFALYGVEGTTVHVSNFYAADYIDGDANRDGVLDLKDVVRAKKLFAGLTTEGNKLAVTSDDYIIDAVDITSLSNIVLAELFK